MSDRRFETAVVCAAGFAGGLALCALAAMLGAWRLLNVVGALAVALSPLAVWWLWREWRRGR